MIKQDIERELKESLKSGNTELRDTLRFLMASVKNAEIDLKREATDEDVIAVVQKQVKQHRESIEAFSKAARQELADKEQRELQILQKYLPAQISEEELKRVVEEVISSLSEGEKNSFGKVMGMTMGRVKGKAEGNTVGKVVKELLT